MNEIDRVLATIAKALVTFLVALVFARIFAFVDPDRRILSLLGFWTLISWCWKAINYEGKNSKDFE